MTRTKELIKNTFIIGIGKFGSKILTFLLLPLYTSCLEPSEYGIYDLLIIIATLLTPIITMLMEEAMFRFLIDAKSKDEIEEITSSTICYIFISTIVLCTLTFFILVIFDLKYKYIFVLYLLCSIIEITRNAFVRGLGKIKLFSISCFFNSVIMLILNVVFLLIFKWGVSGLLISYIFATTLVSFVVFFKTNILKYLNLKKVNNKKVREMIKYSLPLVPNSISWSIINLSDRVVISSFLGTTQNGIYSVSHKFPSIIDSIYSFFYTAWKEIAAKTLNDDEPYKFYNYVYKKVQNILFSFVLIIIAMLPFIFNYIIQENYSDSYNYIPILLVAVYYSNMSGFYGGIFSAYKKTKIMGTTTIVAAIINLLFNIIFIKYIGIWAAAVSTLISNIYVYYYRKIKISRYVKFNNNIFFIILSSIVLALVCYCYYINNKFFQILSLLITFLYCIYTNKDIITIIKNNRKGGSNEI